MSTTSDSLVSSVSFADVYALARHYRFQWEEAQQCYVLLFPEGMVKLNGGAGEVLKRIDGEKNVGEIFAELETAFPGVPDLKSDVIAMIELALEKAWIEKRG
ncbi:pyrroloquinoline quinone biosynthesis protein PqqD [Methylovorus sp. MM2]|uniref:pyrroloquinoline quinone biosynthesis peptide chaperone PqqD n=1 Tax=Methylovorus sp. MM2 TaxID=1848038 RepID=UPI0007DFE7A5|nr:pyrroloquinoline quinone biosynthesis peptide chaperone PqqD [Methylovorus sp. MM2]OAM52857.1 pyrroloquinoline quinone biosynthesis protein PqqD [Methylovorus sp. MM2]